ncbi:hypothetical protein [Legionella tunisiensis]|uniref:hypothetical protein n=1 Tax=Legionella tunisiensis TaxID=1034944 RepID=UPI0002D81953|nr:hypothetical protein [Legionella tunisiensis]
MIGEGGFGKVKYLQDEFGGISVIKIQELNGNKPSVDPELGILMDLGLSKGSVERERQGKKSKSYVEMSYLGESLLDRIRPEGHEIVLAKPPYELGQWEINTIYAYIGTRGSDKGHLMLEYLEDGNVVDLNLDKDGDPNNNLLAESIKKTLQGNGEDGSIPIELTQEQRDAIYAALNLNPIVEKSLTKKGLT